MSSQYENGSSRRLSMDELMELNAPKTPRSQSQDVLLARMDSMQKELTDMLREQSREIAELKSRLDQRQEEPSPDGRKNEEPLWAKEFRDLRVAVMRSSKQSEMTSQNAFWLMLGCVGLNILILCAVCFLVLH